MFIDTIIDIAKETSQYKNYSRSQFFTLIINEKLNTHVEEYFKRLSDEDYYLLMATWGTASERFESDLRKVRNLLRIKEETWKNLIEEGANNNDKH